MVQWFDMSFLQTHTGKQILGAISGMAAASLLYVGWQGVATSQISARLVETQTVSEQADIVHTNAKEIDEGTRRLLERRAQQVALQLSSTSSSSSTISTSSTIATLTEFTNPIVPVSVRQSDRIQARINRQRVVRGGDSPAVHRAASGSTVDAEPNDRSTDTQDQTLELGHVDALANSGAGLVFLAIASLAMAGLPLLRRQGKSL